MTIIINNYALASTYKEPITHKQKKRTEEKRKKSILISYILHGHVYKVLHYY